MNILFQLRTWAILLVACWLGGCTVASVRTYNEPTGVSLRVIVDYDSEFAHWDRTFSRYGVQPSLAILDGDPVYIFILRTNDGAELASYVLPNGRGLTTKGFDVTLRPQNITACIRRVYKGSVVESRLIPFLVNDVSSQLLYISYGWVSGSDGVRRSQVMTIGGGSIRTVPAETLDNKYVPIMEKPND